MNILIAVASRYGSTREIADALAQELRDCGHAVTRRSVEEIDAVEAYDAVIVGSAVYMGA